MSDDPMAAILAALADIRAQMATRDDLGRLRADLMARMDGLANNLTNIRDDIAVNHGTADSVRRANDNTRDELRNLGDVVMAMERQILRMKTDIEELKGRQQ
jgi:hypothetical protein